MSIQAGPSSSSSKVQEFTKGATRLAFSVTLAARMSAYKKSSTGGKSQLVKQKKGRPACLRC